MLLYLVKHLHLNLANKPRELSKANDSANPAAYKELLCVIKYVTNMKNLVPMNPGRLLDSVIAVGYLVSR